MTLPILLNRDCWQLILSYTNDPWTYKYTSLTCKTFAEIYKIKLPKICVHYDNPLLCLLYMFPDKPWDWNQVSTNPNIKCIFNIENPGVNHKVYSVYRKCIRHDYSSHTNIRWWGIENIREINSIDELLTHIKKFNLMELSRNPDITWDIVQSHPEIEWDNNFLQMNPNIIHDVVLGNPSHNWNPTVLYYVGLIPSEEFNKRINCSGTNFEWEVIKIDSKINWGNLYLGIEPKISFSNIQSNPYILSKYSRFLQQSVNITWDDIESNSGMLGVDWDFTRLSRNPHITPQIVLEHLEQAWDWYELSRNQSTTTELVMATIDLDWDWKYLSARWDVSWKLITSFPDKEWDWGYVSMNRFQFGKN